MCLAFHFYRLHIQLHLLYSALGKLHRTSLPRVSWTYPILGSFPRRETQGQCCWLKNVLNGLKNSGETQENSNLLYVNILLTPLSLNVQFLLVFLIRIETMPEYKHYIVKNTIAILEFFESYEWAAHTHLARWEIPT